VRGLAEATRRFLALGALRLAEPRFRVVAAFEPAARFLFVAAFAPAVRRLRVVATFRAAALRFRVTAFFFAADFAMACSVSICRADFDSEIAHRTSPRHFCSRRRFGQYVHNPAASTIYSR
jgi:hypothetical protein